MKITRFSSTELKRNTAEVINSVAFGGATAVIERHGEPIVKITPVSAGSDKTNLDKKLKKYFGVIPSFPDVTKHRHFRKKRIAL